ncbi:MAG: peptide ABC transporter substrate-binding protein [Pseudonocardiaceae bacterium]
MRLPMRTRRVAAWLAVPVSMALLATGCGQAQQGGQSQQDATISVFTTEPENPLVPGNTTETGGGKVVDALFTGLVGYDPETAEPYNEVAESIETTDSKVYTIKLERGWTFHDGTPVQADDFVDAWNYTAYSPNAQQSASFFAQIQGYADVHTEDPDGENGPQQAPQPAAKTMSGLRVVDDYTIEVTLAEPFAVFPTQLGYSAFSPLPDAFFTDQEAFEANPIGNGGFRFESRQPGVNITLSRYEDYAGERKPSVAGVEFRIYESDEAAYADVVANNLDFLDTLPPSAVTDNLYRTDLENRSVSRPILQIQTMTFPLYDPRYANPDLRRALSMAIDREQLNEQIFNGTRPPADGLVAPNIPGRGTDQCGELCEFRPEEAKRLFDATGFTGPIELTSNVDAAGNEEWMTAACNSIANALGRECRFVPVTTFGQFREAINARQMSAIYRSGWVADYPSVENFLNPLYRTGASSNDGDYSSPSVDAKLAEADAATSEDRANQLYQEAERMVIQDMPAIPVYFYEDQSGWSERLRNVTATPLGELDLVSVRVG